MFQLDVVGSSQFRKCCLFYLVFSWTVNLSFGTDDIGKDSVSIDFPSGLHLTFNHQYHC